MQNKPIPQTVINPFIEDSVIYSAISYLLTDTTYNHFLKYEKLSEKWQIAFPFQLKDDSLELTKMDTIFSTKDVEFILTQKNMFYQFRVNGSKIGNRIIVPEDSLELSKNLPYSFITLPIFNMKKDKLIICFGYYCGVLCAEGGTYIYQKKGGRWIRIKIINEWIS
jgi:hypothetical protein